MQLKEVALLLGTDNKEVIAELEARRDEFTAKGFKVAKKLNAASALDQELAKLVLASFDVRRQESAQAEHAAEERRRREEDERRREADRIVREKDEEERRAKADAARQKADAEIARRQAELARQEEAARQAEVARQQAEAHAAAEAAAKAAAEKAAAKTAPPAAAEQPAAAAAAAPAVAAAPAPTTPPPTVATPVAPPVVAAPAPPPSAPQRHSAPPPPMADPMRHTGPGPRFPANRPPGSMQGGPPTYNPRPQNFDRPPRDPRFNREGQGQQGQPPRFNRDDRTGPPGAPGQPPRFNRDDRTGPVGAPGQPPRFNREGGGQPGAPGQAPRFNRDDRGGPRPAGPPGADRRPGAQPYPPRHDGPRPARPGGPMGRGDDRGGPRPGGDRRPGAGPGRGPGHENRPAGVADVRAFVERGLDSTVTDDFRRTQARRGAKPAKPAAERDKDKDWSEEAAKNRKAGKPVTDDSKKKFRPSQIFNVDAVSSERRSKPRRRGPGDSRDDEQQIPEGPKAVVFYGDFTIGEFASKTHLSLTDVMGKLFGMGRMMTINQLLDPDLAEELALEFDIEIRIEREGDDADIAEYVDIEDSEEELLPRAPVVTVMGHVDHGKTSLLDRIREADVASKEFGGITQHIGAYLVKTPKGNVVFLDTPGHEAFTEMRSRGANVTDLVVLVVAANDGVMPQTVEAINHAKAAKVPILVAINKVDVPGANPERVKQELMKYELVPEEYGGDTIMIPVSALTGHKVPDLLEYIALQTEILELKANPNRPAVGTAVESHIDPLRGATATILIENGTLRIGDCFVCGTEFGRIRAMSDDKGNPIEEAGPATPVEILGLRGSPTAGEVFVVTPDEGEARDIAERRLQRRKKRSAIVKQHISLDNLAERIGEEETLNLNLILKGDVQGSVEAISNALLKIRSDKVFIKILHAAVGAVSSSDIQLADASEAIILAFNVGVDSAAKNLAEEVGVDVRKYQIIYALLEDIEKAMVGMLKPEFQEKEEGRAKILQTFKVSKLGTIAGCFVEEGTVANNHQVRLLRGGTIIWRGKVKSLRRVKDDVKQVQSGLECGIGLDGYNDVKEGDIIEFFSLVQQAVSLVSSDAVQKN
jgi:translation initiation factor IF-2